jgi:acyl carrier protein
MASAPVEKRYLEIPRREQVVEDNELRGQLKTLIIESLNLTGMTPDVFADDVPLFGEGMGLDSVDALELAVAIEKRFGIRIEDGAIAKEAFASIASLSAFVQEQLGMQAQSE